MDNKVNERKSERKKIRVPKEKRKISTLTLRRRLGSWFECRDASSPICRAASFLAAGVEPVSKRRKSLSSRLPPPSCAMMFSCFFSFGSLLVVLSMIFLPTINLLLLITSPLPQPTLQARISRSQERKRSSWNREGAHQRFENERRLLSRRLKMRGARGANLRSQGTVCDAEWAAQQMRLEASVWGDEDLISHKRSVRELAKRRAFFSSHLTSEFFFPF